jgi:hypothetical protein
MGILTLLRNAFGRSRKGRTAEAEGADRTSSPEPQPTVPSPSPEPEPTPTAQVPEPRLSSQEQQARREAAEKAEHDLVAAAFDNIAVPKQTETPTAEPEQAPAAEAAEPEQAGDAEVTEPEPVAEADAAEPEPAADIKVTEPEPVAEEPKPEPAADAEVTEPEPVVEVTPEPKPEPVADAKAEATEPEPATDIEVTEPEPVTAAEVTEPEPAAEEAKPESEPEAVVEAEPAVEATPEPEPATEAAPAAEVTEPEPAVKATPEPVAETAPEPEAEPAAEAEPVAAAAEPTPVEEPEPAPALEQEPVEATIDEPAAADGEDAPQGPLAADDESSTGGAGGNNPAEGEAEAGAAELPQGLRSAHKSAATTLTKLDLTGTRAKLYLVLDRSASMRPYYKDGSAQALAEQTLALAAHLDPEAKVHVVFFSTELDGTGELTLNEYENKIDELHAALGRMGRTSYHVAVEEVIAHHTKTAPDTPALVIFQTDGAPDAKTPATQALTDAAKNHPSVFFSFVAFGDPENKAFDYLRKLKTDNTAHFLAGETPRELTDKELYEGVLANWRP